MKVVSFYRFLDIVEPSRLRAELQTCSEKHALLGTVLVAHEGVNGTLAGEEAALHQLLGWLQQALQLNEPFVGRWTDVSVAPFERLRVKVKKEIVTLGRPDLRPYEKSGKAVDPEDWNQLIGNPQTLLVDTRNHYEVEVGMFPNAVDPGTDNFRQFQKFAENLDEADKNRPVAMYCTGGIRCEKATALMLELGFSDVYMLKGGILNYLEQLKDEDNRWQGECFVFDKRVAVDRDLAEGGYVQCHACRRPLSDEDMQSPDYLEGVSCHHCVGTLSDDRSERFAERRKQVGLARARGDTRR